MKEIEIKQADCVIKCTIDADRRGDAMHVTFPKWFTNEWIHAHREMVQKIARYTANKLEMQTLTDMVSIAKEMHTYGFEIAKDDGVWVFYDGDKSALIRPYIHANKLDIRPFITFDSVHENGFTLTPGSFSDFIISTRSFDEQLFAYTKDFSHTHFGIASLYVLHWLANLDTFINKKDVPIDFDDYAIYHFQRMHPYGREITVKIEAEIHARCSVNKSKRIDTLIVNQKNIYDYIREYDLNYRVSIRGVSLLQTAIRLGKTVWQVEQFVKKYIDRKRIS